MTDFSIMDEVVVIEVGEIKVCTSVELSVDEIVEGTESLILYISSASPFVNFDPNNLLDINIQDDDCKSSVRLYFQLLHVYCTGGNFRGWKISCNSRFCLI